MVTDMGIEKKSSDRSFSLDQWKLLYLPHGKGKENGMSLALKRRNTQAAVVVVKDTADLTF